MAKRTHLDQVDPLGDTTQFCNRSELDFFKSPKKEDPVIGFQDIIRRPIGSIDNNGPLTFQIIGSELLFTDLQQTYLAIDLKVTKEDGTSIKRTLTKNSEGVVNGEKLDVSVPNDFFDCLFTKVSLFLNGVKVGSEHNYYPQVAVLRILTSYADEAAQHNIKDTIIWTPGAGDDLREAFYSIRYKYIADSKKCTLIGRLSHDVFNSVRLLPPNTDIMLRFDRSLPEFCLVKPTESNANARFTVKLLDARLMIRRVKLTESVTREVEMHFKNGSPIYLPFLRTDARAFEVPIGTTNWRASGLFTGILPERALFVLTDPESLGSGSYKNNPTIFPAKKYKLSSMQFYVNEKPILPQPYEFDWDNKQYQDAFHGLLSTLGLAHSSNKNCNISYRSFGEDFAVFAVSFKAVKVEENVGVISIEIGFKTATVQTIAGLLVPEFRSCIVMNSDKQISQHDF